MERFSAWFSGGTPANVELLTVNLKPGAKAVEARPRSYNTSKVEWLSTWMAALMALGLACFPIQASCLGECCHSYAEEE